MSRCQFDRRQDELTHNVSACFTRAEPSDLADGALWYPKATRICQDWAVEYGLPVQTVACVVAAISPQCDWDRNLVIAADVLAGRSPSIGGALPRNVDKARRILADKALSTVDYMPHGPKVANFAENLAGNYAYVTVDTHCIQAALDDVCSRLTLRWRPYTVFACAYAAAAKIHGIEPAVFQSIVWHVWKRENPRVSKIQKRTRWTSIATE